MKFFFLTFFPTEPNAQLAKTPAAPAALVANPILLLLFGVTTRDGVEGFEEESDCRVLVGGARTVSG